MAILMLPIWKLPHGEPKGDVEYIVLPSFHLWGHGSETPGWSRHRLSPLICSRGGCWPIISRFDVRRRDSVPLLVPHGGFISSSPTRARSLMPIVRRRCLDLD